MRSCQKEEGVFMEPARQMCPLQASSKMALCDTSQRQEKEAVYELR